MKAHYRFGFFGGSFDPVHRGHVALARAAVRELKLDRLFIVPAALSPHKQKNPPAPARQRIAALKKAFGRGRRFVILPDEIRRGGVSYTYDTLRRLARRHRRAEWFLVMGEDALAHFKSWRNWRGITKIACIAVGRRRPRPRVPLALRDSAIYLKAHLPMISSTQIREKHPLSRPSATLPQGGRGGRGG